MHLLARPLEMLIQKKWCIIWKIELLTHSICAAVMRNIHSWCSSIIRLSISLYALLKSDNPQPFSYPFSNKIWTNIKKDLVFGKVKDLKAGIAIAGWSKAPKCKLRSNQGLGSFALCKFANTSLPPNQVCQLRTNEGSGVRDNWSPDPGPRALLVKRMGWLG